MPQQEQEQQKKCQNEYTLVKHSKDLDLTSLKSFDCGDAIINGFAKNTIRPHATRNVSSCYFLVHNKTGKVVGFYTLSSYFLLKGDLASMQLPSMPTKVPVTRLGMFAISTDHQGNGFGAMMLWDALEKALAASTIVGSVGVFLDAAKNKASFYKNLGFSMLEAEHSGENETTPMFIKMQTIQEAIQAATEQVDNEHVKISDA